MRRQTRTGHQGRIRVLFVHHRNELGGAPTSLSYLIQNLGAEFDPHIFCPPGRAADLFERAGATVHTGPVAAFTHIWASVYRGRRWLLLVREIVRLPGHIVAFRRVLRSEQFDVVHLNDSPLIVAGWLARRAQIPVVWHLRSSLPNAGQDGRSRFIRAAVRRLSTISVAITQDIADVFAVNSKVVANSVDLDRFHSQNPQLARAELGLDDGRVVTYFGFIYPSKGFREFIDAAALLQRRGVRAQYLVVGGAVRGPEFFRTFLGRTLRLLDLTRNYEAEARARVAALGLEERFHFIPFTEDTATLYQASDVVVAPSRGPELGRPVIEAAASGVPVVATGSRTGAGVVEPGRTGVLVERDTVDGLADAIETLLVDESRRTSLGHAARAHAERMFDPQRNARVIEAIYRSVVPAHTDRIPVLYVHHRPQLGGAPASLAQLIQNLDERFEAHVFCPPGAAAELFDEAGAIVHTGKVSIFAHAWDNPYHGMRWLVLTREVLSLWPHVRQLEDLMRRYRFPIVHLNDSPLLPAAYVAHRNGAKVVWHLRSALAGEGRDRRSAAIASVIDRWGNAAIAIDQDVADRFPVHLPMTIVHNSVPIGSAPSVTSAKQALGLPADRVAVGFAGFVRRQKGWPELVEAAEILVRDGVPVQFAIMGGGVRPPAFFRTSSGRLLEFLGVLEDEETAIRDLVAKKGLTSHFSFLPFTANTAEVYSAVDIVTFPNQGIGLGRPVLEAAMHGKPVVASGSRTGAGVLLPDRTGILVGDPSPTKIAQALKTLISDVALREEMGAVAAAHARSTFDPAANARAVERVYDDLLGIAPATEADSALSAAV